MSEGYTAAYVASKSPADIAAEMTDLGNRRIKASNENLKLTAALTDALARAETAERLISLGSYIAEVQTSEIAREIVAVTLDGFSHYDGKSFEAVTTAITTALDAERLAVKAIEHNYRTRAQEDTATAMREL